MGSVDIRLPNINGSTEKEQLQQLKSYLYQFAEQLKWAFNTLESGGASASGNHAIVMSSTNEAIEAEKNFNSIKALIIKSADIVDSYYEKMSKRLEGDYVAKSDFGEYSEKTSAEIEANSKAIEQYYTDMQSLQTTLEEINSSLIETAAYIKSGLLGYDDDGTPIYGVEVGQTNEVDGVNVFDKFSRFTSDRLSFYDRNDVEVAYIGDYKLYIVNAEIRGSLKLGGYLIDTTDGLAFKWVGRG